MVEQRLLREEARKALAREDVRYLIGYEPGSGGIRVRPFFAQRPEDLERLVFSPLCVHNLSVYLTLEERLPLPRGVEPDPRKTAILVKGCDSRALVQLLAEGGIDRERIYIIGVPCTGVVDPQKLEGLLPGVQGPAEVIEEGEGFIVRADGQEHRFPRGELLMERCSTCRWPNPLVYDVLVGEEVEPRTESWEDIEALGGRTLEERWEFWRRQFSRCIRCYACRQVCPLCYCEDCILERLSPQWIRRSVTLPENAVYHITRTLHLAGRCVDCGECTRVCPMGIPLDLLNRKLVKDVEELFGFTAGTDPQAPPLLGSFRPEDPEEEIL